MTTWQWSVILAMCRLLLELSGVTIYHNKQRDKDLTLLKEAVSRG